MKILLSTVAVATAVPMAAQTATLDAEAVASGTVAIALDEFNAIGTAHTEGPAYVGGNLNSSTAFYANSDSMPEVDIGGVTGGLIVGGDINADLQKTGQTPGSVEIGGSFNGNPNTGGYVVTEGVSGIPVEDMKTTFEDVSTTASALSDTADASFDTSLNLKSFTSGSGGGDNIAYLNLSFSDATDMFAGNQGQIGLDFDTSLDSFIINVAGTDFTGSNAISASIFRNYKSESEKVLFNFYEATDIVMDGNLNGSILAPGATVDSPTGGMNGTLISLNINQQGEIRPYDDERGFGGALPATTTMAPVPLPAGGWLLLSAFGGLVGLRRRRNVS